MTKISNQLNLENSQITVNWMTSSWCYLLINKFLLVMLVKKIWVRILPMTIWLQPHSKISSSDKMNPYLKSLIRQCFSSIKQTFFLSVFGASWRLTWPGHIWNTSHTIILSIALKVWVSSTMVTVRINGNGNKTWRSR